MDVSYDFDVAKVGVAFLYGAGEEHWRPIAHSHYHFNTTGNDDFQWSNIIVPGDAACSDLDPPRLAWATPPRTRAT